jgi:hypothetical protein
MIERVLPSGEVAEFPDDTPPDEIERVIAEYLAATATDSRTDAEASGATGMRPILRRPTRSDGPVSPDTSPAPPPEPEPEPVVSLRMLNVEPFVRDEGEETPEQRRERVQRRERPARLDPPDPYGDDRFRDNWWPNWHRPR